VTKRETEEIFYGDNAGATRHQGLEIWCKMILLKDTKGKDSKLELVATYSQSTDLFTRFTDDGIDYAGNYLPGIPGNTAMLQIILRPLRKLTIHGDYQYTGRQYLNDLNSGTTDPWSVLNTKITYLFPIGSWGKLNIYLGVKNILNEKYVAMLVPNAPSFGSPPRYYYPGLPRQFYCGIRLQIH
jgi:iron complex outermembrane receptor protein